MPTVPASELDRRAECLRERMRRHAPPLDAVLVVQNADLYYFAGTVQTAHYLLPESGAPSLLVRKVLERARSDSALGDVRPLPSLKDLPAELRRRCGPPPWRVGMELDVVPAATLRAYTGLFGKDAEILDASPLILACRAVKSEWEVGEITRAAELHNGVFGSIPELLQGEVSSYELQCLLQAKAASLGHCGVVRMRGLNLETPIGIVLSGEEGAVPSHSLFPMGGEGTHPWVAQGGSRRKIAPDTPIIADFLMSLSGYHADATRMAVKGRFPDEAAEIFASLRRVLRYAESLLRAGAVPSAVYRDVVELAGSLGLADGFMGPKELQVPFVGHGVGLEVNEVPVLAPRFDEPLASGTTLAVEPKYTHSRWGVIGVENTYVVREGGVELLTRVPEDVIAG